MHLYNIDLIVKVNNVEILKNVKEPFFEMPQLHHFNTFRNLFISLLFEMALKQIVEQAETMVSKDTGLFTKEDTNP